MAAFVPDSDSEDELPPGWEERATLEGDVFYANHLTKATQWSHPRTGKKKRVPTALPFGWERRVDEKGSVVYVDHQNQRTTFTDPRLAFATEEHETGSSDGGAFRQRFDGSTVALQILHGTDLSGKVVIVTGANAGIGFETARALALHGCTVILACRSLKKADEAIEKIRAERPQATCVPMQVELASLRSVAAFAQEFLQRFDRLDVLIMNAGLFGVPFTLTDEDQCELMFQVNYLSQFYLADLLKERMSQVLKPRVVLVSSESHRYTSFRAEGLTKEAISASRPSTFISMLAYNNSKWLQVAFALEATERWRQLGIRCYAVHPGNMVSSSIARHWWPYRLLFALVRPFTKSLEQAASSTVFAAFAPEMEERGGTYINNCFPCTPSALALDAEARKTCWELTWQILNEKIHQ